VVTHAQHRFQSHSKCGRGKQINNHPQLIKQIFHSCCFGSGMLLEMKGTGDPICSGDQTGTAALGRLPCHQQTAAARTAEPERREPAFQRTSSPRSQLAPPRRSCLHTQRMNKGKNLPNYFNVNRGASTANQHGSLAGTTAKEQI